MSGRWFRMYEGVLDDPKVQRLDGEAFKAWVNLLCLASRNGGVLPGIEDVAFALRRPPDEARAMLEQLRAARLLDRRGRGASAAYAPHRWAERQYKSDVSTDRVKRFRKRFNAVSETAAETAPESEPETESEPDPPKPPAAGGPGPASDSILLAGELCAIAGIAACGPAPIAQAAAWLADGIDGATIRRVVREICGNAPGPTRSLKRFDGPVRRAAMAPAPAAQRPMNLDELGAAARWCDDHDEPARAADYRRQAAALRAKAKAAGR
jgi:hypothetical protein